MHSTTPPRLHERPWTLLRRTLGDRASVGGKLRRAGFVLRSALFPRQTRERLRTLQELGWIEQMPTRTQFVFGSVDMFRFFIVPCAADYYRSKNISFAFHALLRVLDDPATMMDPTGLLSHRDAIIGHLLQVTHADPIYDLQVLAGHEQGLDELERQLEAILSGTHPRGASIGAIVEDLGYHARLLDYVRRFRRDPDAQRMLRENIVGNADFEATAATFGDLSSAIAYFASLPERPWQAFVRLLRTHEFPKPAPAQPAAAANDGGPGHSGDSGQWAA